MRRVIIWSAVIAVTVMMCGCAIPYGAATYGGVYTSVKGPVTGVDNSVQCVKSGVAVAKSIVCVGTGDASISAAMSNGGIKKVHHVDNEFTSFLGVFAEYKTTVYGE